MPSSPRWCPISGSAYTYSYATLGELVAWIIGWDLIIEYAVGNVAVAISWGNYFKTLVSGFGIVIPDWLSTDYRTAAHIPGLFAGAPHLFGVPIVFNILAFGIVAASPSCSVIGIRESATHQHGDGHPQADRARVLRRVGWGYMHAGELAAVCAERLDRRPGRARRSCSLPTSDSTPSRRSPKKRAIRAAISRSASSDRLIICTVIYVVVAAGLHRHHSLQRLVEKLATEQAEPLTMALQYANIRGWGICSSASWRSDSVVAHTAVLLVFQLGQPRIFFSMARDGLLPPSFAQGSSALPHAARRRRF